MTIVPVIKPMSAPSLRDRPQPAGSAGASSRWCVCGPAGGLGFRPAAIFEPGNLSTMETFAGSGRPSSLFFLELLWKATPETLAMATALRWHDPRRAAVAHGDRSLSRASRLRGRHSAPMDGAALCCGWCWWSSAGPELAWALVFVRVFGLSLPLVLALGSPTRYCLARSSLKSSESGDLIPRGR